MLLNQIGPIIKQKIMNETYQNDHNAKSFLLETKSKPKLNIHDFRLNVNHSNPQFIVKRKHSMFASITTQKRSESNLSKQCEMKRKQNIYSFKQMGFQLAGQSATNADANPASANEDLNRQLNKYASENGISRGDEKDQRRVKKLPSINRLRALQFDINYQNDDEQKNDRDRFYGSGNNAFRSVARNKSEKAVLYRQKYHQVQVNKLSDKKNGKSNRFFYIRNLILNQESEELAKEAKFSNALGKFKSIDRRNRVLAKAKGKKQASSPTELISIPLKYQTVHKAPKKLSELQLGKKASLIVVPQKSNPNNIVGWELINIQQYDNLQNFV